MKSLKFLIHLILVILLTIVTQIGGVIWLFSLGLNLIFGLKKRYSFPILYLTFNLLIVPPIAMHLGRERLPIFSKYLKPINWFYSQEKPLR